MKYDRIKQKFFDILDKSIMETLLDKAVNVFILLLILLNTISIIIEPSVKNINFKNVLNVFEITSIIIFSIEYLLRIWVSDLLYKDIPSWKARLKYFVSGMAIIDLLAILPFYIPFIIKADLRVLRMLRLFRLFRIFKANRYTNGMSLLIQVIKNKSSELASSILVVLTLIIIAAQLMYNFENIAQPEMFESFFDALWWATSTVTTIGYGDIYPITVMGKWLAGVIAILGIGIVAIPTGIIASGFYELINNKKTCPHCGKRIEE